MSASLISTERTNDMTEMINLDDTITAVGPVKPWSKAAKVES